MDCHRDLDTEVSAGSPFLRDPLLYGVALIAIAVCAPIFRYLIWLGDEGVVLQGESALSRVLRVPWAFYLF
jgi:hypothetical protein